jgi:hypothetical protein
MYIFSARITCPSITSSVFRSSPERNKKKLQEDDSLPAYCSSNPVEAERRFGGAYCLIALMMVAINIPETSTSITLHGAVYQKAAIFIVAAVRT